jgi:ATP-dependent Clp protease ATP-binding subunit ClpX
MREIERPLPRIPQPRQIYEELDRYVIGQHEAKQVVATAAYNHFKRVTRRQVRPDGLLKKSNILLIGPTGCGKTHIARNLARILDVPFVVCDATEYTEAGYYGKDVEVMIAELLFQTDQDVAATSRGIVFVDEIDKIARRSHGARTGAGSRDIGGEGVQQSLLKLLEGREIFVPLNVTQHWNKHDFVQVDTTDILFICAGTFSDLPDLDGDKNIGFGAGIGAKQAGPGAKRRRVTAKALMDYGLIAELVGRLPVTIQMQKLSEHELKRILTEPPDSVVREYTELLAMDEVELRFAPDGLDAVVRFAIDRKLGARGLRGILEEVLRETMFLAPELTGQTRIVDRELVEQRLERTQWDLPSED